MTPDREGVLAVLEADSQQPPFKLQLLKSQAQAGQALGLRQSVVQTADTRNSACV